jgi:hypothetical protein
VLKEASIEHAAAVMLDKRRHVDIGHLLSDWGHRILASYPRSGNTYTRAVISYILAAKNNTNPAMIDRMRRYTPDFYLEREFQPGAIVKTHSHYIPKYEGPSVYLIRNPKDVAQSTYRYWTQKTQTMPPAPFSDFLEHMFLGEWGLFASWPAHVRSWRQHSRIVTYETLMKRPRAAFRIICDTYGIAATPGEIGRAIRACTMEELNKEERANKQDMENLVAYVDPKHHFFEASPRDNLFTQADTDLLNSRCADIMQLYGYGD